MGLILLAAPAAAVLLFLLPGKKYLHLTSIITLSVLTAVSTYVTNLVIQKGTVAYGFLGGLFYVDALSIIVLDIVILISLAVSIYSVGYLKEELKHGKIDTGRIKIYYILMHSFIFTMILALTVRNMGIMWIAIEATTLASAFLVGFYNDKPSIEAAWKYIIICSVGIAIALLGIIFLQISAMNVLEGSRILDWTALVENASMLKSSTLKLAFIFILLGFGTKAGLAPMHTWLPDAHSQAPSPISALLSGVLLNSAMYGIIRATAIVNRNLGSSLYSSKLLIAFGMLSIAAAAIFIITQKDYKRLLAYSSIEHMGIIALAVGIFSPASVYGAILHMINHSFTKSMLFLTSGNIYMKYGTREIAKVKGVLRLMPITGTAFLVGLFAITGAPPFSVFVSEFSIIVSTFQPGRFMLGSAFVILLAIVFVGVAATLFSIFYGDDDASKNMAAGESNKPGVAVIVVFLLIISVTGLYMPESIADLIQQAQRIIIGG